MPTHTRVILRSKTFFFFAVGYDVFKEQSKRARNDQLAVSIGDYHSYSADR
jgi:hypothetical protein